MKHTLFAFLLISSSLSHAGCLDVAEFENEKIRMYIGDGGCGPMEIIIWEYKDDKIKPSSIKHLDFYKECGWKNQRNAQISCRINPENPISGATYKRFKSGSYSCEGWKNDAYKYKCIKGCDGKPAFLEEPKNCS